MKFYTNYYYTDRQTKARYVYLKYKPILSGKILDVGADMSYLKQYLKKNVSYLGIGLGYEVDQQVNLEKEPIPFDNNTFDCVLCLDVLEHIDNIHEVFDELCKVSKKYLIVSLPNPHKVFADYLRHGDYYEHQHMKFYGLPLEKPEDRHKWFFSTEEAEKFIRYRAKKNNMGIVQLDIEGSTPPKIGIIEKLIFKFLLKKVLYLLPWTQNQNLHTSSLWVVLEKRRVLDG